MKRALSIYYSLASMTIQASSIWQLKNKFYTDEIAMVVNHKPKMNISPWLFHLAVNKQIIYK